MKIVTFIQSSDNQINSMSLESLAAAQKMKKMCNGELHLVIFNNDLGNALLEYECDSVIILDNSQLQNYNHLFLHTVMKQETGCQG